MRFRFDDCELDVGTVELRVGGEHVAVEPQVFDVLSFLVRHRDRMVSKEELLDEVWHHRFVTDSALSSRIKSARRAIGDDGKAQRLIRTVHGRGFQFIGDVLVEDGDDQGRTGGLANRASRPGSLPRPATRTIGRTHDIERVLDRLARGRVVTLLGPGGVGKTRLAIEVASRCEGDVAFVDLTKVREAGLVPDLIVRELGVQAGTDSTTAQVLEEALRGCSLLLVLDNFEHVLDAAPVVADLVGWAPGVQVVVTSRARLRVAGEHVVDVAPLSLEPEPHTDGGSEGLADAVALFEQAATAVDPDFRVGPHLADIVTICRTVDGLPLAIELAAGHLRTLTPALLRTRLGARLGSAAAGLRDAPARQQTVPAMIDWSLQLLGPAEQRLFARLGVFSGPVSLEMVEHVCGFPPVDDAVEALTRLVDQSLVRRVSGTRHEPRFVQLELLRERAGELLAASEDLGPVGARHAAWVADFLDDIDERRWGDLSDRWIDLINEQLSEIRAAHAWADQHEDLVLAARITADLGTFWHREGHYAEGRGWVDDARRHMEELDQRIVAKLELAGGFVDWPRDAQAAGAHWARAIEGFRGLGDDRYLAYALALSAGPYIGDREEYERAMRLCDEGIEAARRVGERPLIAQALNIRGELARVHGDDALALAAYEEGRDLAMAAGDDAHLSVFLANLSYLADHRGDYEEARRLGTDALRLCWSLGRRMMAAWTVSELAGPELGLGRPERGALLVGAADEALRVLGATRHPGDRGEHDRVLAGLRAALGDEELTRLMDEGARLSLAEAVELVLSEPDGSDPTSASG